MNSMGPKRDMLAALRLTRDGRLKQAAAVLRGAATPKTVPASQPGRGVLQTLLTIPASVQDALRGGRHGTAAYTPPGARFETRNFACPAGARGYRLYIPSGGGTETPLVIMLHGCTQSAEDFAAGTRMNELAEQHKFLVAYPEQSRMANMNKCWNWFKPEDAGRDTGEAAIIAGIAREIAAEFRVPGGKIYAAGLSAGGAQAANLAAAYPELFAGIAIHSGLAAGAAHSLPSAMAAMQKGARATDGSGATPTIVFQGDADTTVNPANAARILEPFGAPVSVRDHPAGSGAGYTSARYGKAELWSLHGLGHGWSGGSPAGSFTEPRGPDASAEIVRFFGL